MGRSYAGILGLVAFSTVLARRFIDGGSDGPAMLTASGALVIFAIIGWIVGAIAERTVEDSVRFRLRRELAAHQVSSAEQHGAPTTVSNRIGR